MDASDTVYNNERSVEIESSSDGSTEPRSDGAGKVVGDQSSIIHISNSHVQEKKEECWHCSLFDRNMNALNTRKKEMRLKVVGKGI